MKLYKSNYSRRFVTILVLLLAIVFFLALKSSETVSEYFYARGITRAYVFAVGLDLPLQQQRREYCVWQRE